MVSLEDGKGNRVVFGVSESYIENKIGHTVAERERERDRWSGSGLRSVVVNN